jgi:proteasome lid subunit RPN8/RPN11
LSRAISQRCLPVRTFNSKRTWKRLKEFVKERLSVGLGSCKAMKKFLPYLEIPEGLLKRVIEHARREYPLESCGILAGKDGKITDFYPMVNTEKSSSFYLMEPEEQLRVFLEMERKGLELSAIYHSHPHTAAFPSQRDIDNAFYPTSLILIPLGLIPRSLLRLWGWC